MATTWIPMASMALEDGKGRRKAPSVRPGQLEEMAWRQMATWVAMAALALEDGKGLGWRMTRLEEMATWVALVLEFGRWCSSSVVLATLMASWVAMASEDRSSSVRPGQLQEEMASEVREAPSVRPGQLDEAPSVRPGQLDEMTPFEVREAPSVRPGQQEELASSMATRVSCLAQRGSGPPLGPCGASVAYGG